MIRSSAGFDRALQFMVFQGGGPMPPGEHMIARLVMKAVATATITTS